MRNAIKAVFTAVLVLTLASCTCIKETSGEAVCRREIIIDPGHGGIDGGAVGISGVIEKDVNLDISLKLKCLLEFMGYDVIMTRETDISIHDGDAQTVRQKKISDLHNRLLIASEHPRAVYLSIHQNNFGDSSQRGMCFYYSPNDPQSKDFAEALRESMLMYLQPENKRQIKAADKSLFIMYNAENPAVLIECGFLSNPDEEKLLTAQEYQYKICLTVLSALTSQGL